MNERITEMLINGYDQFILAPDEPRILRRYYRHMRNWYEPEVARHETASLAQKLHNGQLAKDDTPERYGGDR